MLDLTKEEAEALQVAKIFMDYKVVKAGRAPVTNIRKDSVVRVEWVSSSHRSFPTERSRAAYHWLYENSWRYREYCERHRNVLQQRAAGVDVPIYIWTSDLLLGTHGIEVAIRPHLYPWTSFGDTDIPQRLQQLHRCSPGAHTSIKTSFMRKVHSRIAAYSLDFMLQCLLYDIHMARSLMMLVSIAERQNAAPETLSTNYHTFDIYWKHQADILSDVVRRRGASANCFITIAPAEWKFPLHSPLFEAYDKDRSGYIYGRLSEIQGFLTQHLYHVLTKTVYTTKTFYTKASPSCRGPRTPGPLGAQAWVTRLHVTGPDLTLLHQTCLDQT